MSRHHPILLLIVFFAALAAFACSDDPVSGGVGPTPDPTPEPEPEPDPNPAPEPDPNDALADCRATCEAVVACEGFEAVCDNVAGALAACQGRCEDEDERRALLSISGLGCGAAVPIAIDDLDLAEPCGGDINDPLVAECLAACEEIADCAELAEACGDEVAAAFPGDCAALCSDDEGGRAAIIDANGFVCPDAVESIIEIFELGADCFEEMLDDFDEALARANEACALGCEAYAGDACLGETLPLEDCLSFCDYGAVIAEGFPELGRDEVGIACVDAHTAFEECLSDLSCEEVEVYFTTEEEPYPCQEVEASIPDICAGIADDPIADCRAVCNGLLACQELEDACTEAFDDQFLGNCETACDGDADRAAIFGFGELSCAEAIPQILEAFDLVERCQALADPIGTAVARADAACVEGCDAYAGDQCLGDTLPTDDCLAFCDYGASLSEAYPSLPENDLGVACVDAHTALESCLLMLSCDEVRTFFETEEEAYPCQEVEASIDMACAGFGQGRRAACRGVCNEVIACQPLIDACGEDNAADLGRACRGICNNDPPGRGPILALRGLSCEAVTPLAIARFEFEEACGFEVEDAYAAAIEAADAACTAGCNAYAGDQCLVDFPLQECLDGCDYAPFMSEAYPNLTEDAEGALCVEAYTALESCLGELSCEDVQGYFDAEEAPYPCQEPDEAIFDTCAPFE